MSSRIVRGEATVVEVAPGKFLFLLLNADQAGQMAYQTVFPEPIDPGRRLTAEERNRIHFSQYPQLERMREIGTLPRDFYALREQGLPRVMLVTFPDLTEPTTAQLVDPDDLEASFGPGFALRRISVEITRDPFVYTGQSEQILPWLSSLRSSTGW